jgi:PAS domain S-box-containing protein
MDFTRSTMSVPEEAAIQPDEVRTLRRSMRDLVALSTLPAVWGDFRPEQIAESLADVIVGMIDLDLLLVRVPTSPSQSPYDAVRRRTDGPYTPDQIRTLADTLPVDLSGTRALSRPVGVGTLGAVAMPLGVGDDCGVLLAAFEDPRFPTETDRLFLSVAANQAAMVLQRRRAEEQLRQSQRALTDFVENATVGLHWVGPDGRILWANQAELDLLGCTRDEYIGRHIAEFHADQSVIEDILRRLACNETLENYEARLRRKDGSIRDVVINSNVLWENGEFIHSRCFTRDVTALKQAERALTERAWQAELVAQVAEALTSGDPLRVKLQRCAEALVHFEDAAFARICILNDVESVLELRASAGLYTHLDGPHGRIPVGAHKIGQIASERRLHLTNMVGDDSRISDPAWARREGMVAFAGYPLIVGDRLVGVMALFARHTLSETTVHALESVADGIALGIDQARAERERGEHLLAEQVARARAETERARLQEVFMQAPASVCVLRGPEHVFELANPLYRQLVGGRDVVGRTVRESLPELEGQGFFELLDRVYATGEPHIGTETSVVLEQGGAEGPVEVMLNFVYQPLRAGDGTIEGIFVHAVDVTEQVRARQSVEALATENARLYHRAIEAARVREVERDRLQQVIDALPEGIAIGDEHGRLVMSNAAARAIWGQPPPEADVYGYHVFGATRLDGSPYQSEELPLARSILHGEEIRGDQLLLRNATTGVLSPLLVNSAPLRDPSGRIVGGVAVFQDISALKELERQKDEFLAAASHDLKNPLANIKGRAQLLRRRAARLTDPDGPRLVEGLGQIDQAASRATTMINDLLDATRLQMGRSLDLDPQPMDLVSLVSQVVSEYQQTTDRHFIELKSQVPSLAGTWDLQRLERVLANLFSNAIKYSPQGGVITVTLDHETDHTGAWAVVRVGDRGVGIPAQDLALIFQRFHRGSNVTGRISGTGLGLAGARQIIELHGGVILVESEPGAGSTFIVRLPSPCSPDRTS